jgi:hypothetical protein
VVPNVALCNVGLNDRFLFVNNRIRVQPSVMLKDFVNAGKDLKELHSSTSWPAAANACVHIPTKKEINDPIHLGSHTDQKLLLEAVFY